MKLSRTLALLAVVCLVAPAMAEKAPTSGEAPKACAKTIAKHMGNLPKVTFQVGDAKTSCPKTAGKLEAKTGSAKMFVVAGKSYKTQGEAKKALVTETERFVNAFATPKSCKVSDTHTVAGTKFCCPKGATQAAELVKAAMDKVQMTYKVGTKATACPTTAAKLAKKTGNAKQFVVAGQPTSCNVSARLNLARAKYRAAVQAMAQKQAEDAADQDTPLKKS